MRTLRPGGQGAYQEALQSQQLSQDQNQGPLTNDPVGLPTPSQISPPECVQNSVSPQRGDAGASPTTRGKLPSKCPEPWMLYESPRQLQISPAPGRTPDQVNKHLWGWGSGIGLFYGAQMILM